MLNLTKEEAIDLYLKMAKSDNVEWCGGYYLHLYRGRNIIATADLVSVDRLGFPSSIRISNCTFDLTNEEYEEISSKADHIKSSITKEDILKAL